MAVIECRLFEDEVTPASSYAVIGNYLTSREPANNGEVLKDILSTSRLMNGLIGSGVEKHRCALHTRCRCLLFCSDTVLPR